MTMGVAMRINYVVRIEGRLKSARTIARIPNFYSFMKMVTAAASRVATSNDLPATIVVKLMFMRKVI